MGREVGEELGGGSVVEGLEGFGELAGDADAGVWGEFVEDLHGGGESVRGLEEEGGLAGLEGGIELLAALAFLDRKEAVEGKGVRREAGGNERGGDRGGAGQDGEGDLGITRCFEEAVAGIGEARGAGI